MKEKRTTTGIFLIGIVLILGLVGSCYVYRFWTNRQELVATVVPEELEREATVELIHDPLDITEYFMQAVIAQDQDMALRSFPIDEIGLGFSPVEIIEEQGTFSNDTIVAPSSLYSDYFPIASAELTGNFAEVFEQYTEAVSGVGSLEVVDIAYAKPETQQEPEYQFRSKELASKWGAVNSVELAVLLKADTQLYVTGITAFQYDDYWKIFSPTAELVEGTSEEQPLVAVTQEQYDALTSNAEDTKLKEVLAGDDTKKQIKEREEEEAEVKETLASGEALLPANYFVVNAAYGKTPKDTVKQFLLHLQKKDMTAMMDFGIGGEPGLEKQKAFAVQIKDFYFNLLREEDGTKEESLEELGENADSIVRTLNPNMMFYLDLIDVKEMDEATGEYEVLYWYGGESHKESFYLKEADEGWWIEKIG